MEEDRITLAKAPKIQAWGTSLGRKQKSFRRDSLDPTHRRTVGRFAQEIPKSFDVLAATETLGRTRRLAQSLAGISRRIGRTRPVGLVRGFHRWQLCPCQKRGLCVGKTRRGKGTKWMVVVDGQGIPLGNHLDSASPSEMKLVEKTLANIAVPRKGRGRPRKNPKRLIADKGYDSDPLRESLARRGIELICPYRSNNKERKYHDGRKLRRYKRRWKVERTFAWLGNNRRLIVRQDRDIVIYDAFFHVACLLLTLRRL